MAEEWRWPSRLHFLISHLFDVSLLKTRSGQHAELELLLSHGQFKLNTANATYSFGEKYHAFERAFTALNFKKRNFQKVLVLGGGLGSVCQLMKHVFAQNASYTLIENDPVICELAETILARDFGDKAQILCMDAADFISESVEGFDLVIVDVFKGLEVPKAFTSPQFLKALDQHLGIGVLLFNTISLEPTMAKESRRFYSETFEPLFSNSGSLELKGNIIHWAEKRE